MSYYIHLEQCGAQSKCHPNVSPVFINMMNVVSPLGAAAGGFLMSFSHQMEMKLNKGGESRDL